MMRKLVVATLAVALAASASGLFCSGSDKGNQFKVTWGLLPGGMLNPLSFHSMPRTTAEAAKANFAQVSTREDDKTTVWCPKGDYRVCVLFDQQGSVAGIQLSVKVAELAVTAAPVSAITTPEWTRQTLLGHDVFTATTFFVSKDELLSGGRPMTKDTLTAPNGLYILQTDAEGNETGRLAVANDQQNAPQAGFTEQDCFHGMGKHYFQELSTTSRCEDHRPYFLLFGPKTAKLQGFGYTWYGKPSAGKWLEAPPAMVAKQIAPNSPACMTTWINKYGMFTMHVFFTNKPWNTKCGMFL